MPNDRDAAPVLQRHWELVLFGVWSFVAVVHYAGQFTGHYHGFYAQTEAAFELQVVMFILMMATAFYYGVGGGPSHAA